MQVLFKLSKMVNCEVIERITRFTVRVKINGEEKLALLRNTGRLYDLIYRGSLGVCLKTQSPKKNEFILIGIKVNKEQIALIDTKLQAKAFEQTINLNLIPWLYGWVINSKEVFIQDSKLDYSILSLNNEQGFLELKSAIQFNGYYAKYPDCPTLRGRKHIHLLRIIKRNGYRSIIAFIVAHPYAQAFTPNVNSDPKLAEELNQAYKEGVEVYAVKIYLIKDGSIILLNPNLPIRI
ncbi:MAG: DNA/RNA nuclease SfsA [Nitrososphaerales archaeon]